MHYVFFSPCARMKTVMGAIIWDICLRVAIFFVHDAGSYPKNNHKMFVVIFRHFARNTRPHSIAHFVRV